MTRIDPAVSRVPRRRPDRRPLALLLAVCALTALGLLFAYLPGRGFIAELPVQPPQGEPVVEADPSEAAPVEAPVTAPPESKAAAPLADPQVQPQAHAKEARQREIDARFNQAVSMLHARQYEYAVTALHRVLELAPRLVEAHVNMGYALLGMGQHTAARDFFLTAIDLRPQQTNAYYGLGVALEGEGDIEGALAAMRSFIHISEPEDPYLRKAQSAVWEWQALLQAQAESARNPEPSGPPAETAAQ